MLKKLFILVLCCLSLQAPAEPVKMPSPNYGPYIATLKKCILSKWKPSSGANGRRKFVFEVSKGSLLLESLKPDDKIQKEITSYEASEIEAIKQGARDCFGPMPAGAPTKLKIYFEFPSAETANLKLSEQVAKLLEFARNKDIAGRARASQELLNSVDYKYVNLIPEHLIIITAPAMTAKEKVLLNELKTMLSMKRFGPLKERILKQNMLVYCAITELPSHGGYQSEGINSVIGNLGNKQIGLVVLNPLNTSMYSFTETAGKGFNFGWFPLCTILNEFYELLEPNKEMPRKIFDNAEFQASSFAVDNLWKVVIVGIIKSKHIKEKEFDFARLDAGERDKLFDWYLSRSPIGDIYNAMQVFKELAFNRYQNIQPLKYWGTLSEAALGANVLNNRLKDYLGSKNFGFMPQQVNEGQYRLVLQKTSS
jgi:hypothetical protein